MVNIFKVKPTYYIMIGQAIWALAQALILIVLSRSGGIDLVGIFVLSLTIFGPSCLATSLNLRIFIAVDTDANIDIRSAFILRAVSVIFSIMITGFVLLFMTISSYAAIALLLISSRAVDHSSDIAIGYFQRTNQHQLIGLSYAVRGFSTIVPFYIATKMFDSLILCSLILSISNLFAHIFIDLIPIMRSSKTERRSSVLNTLYIFRAHSVSVFYPFLDSIFLNSLRFTVILFLSTSTLGLVGIAQALYSPIQLAMSTVGYSYLTRARSTANNGNRTNLLKGLKHMAILAIVAGGGFLISALAVPAEWLSYAFGVDGIALKSAIVMIALAMLPLPIVGFAGLTAFALAEPKVPVAAVMCAGIVFFSLLLLAYTFGITMNLRTLVACFTIAGIFRISLCVRALIVRRAA